MSVSLQVVPLFNSLDIYGEPDPFSAYSLSGHVVVNVSNPSTFFGARRPASLLLQSLELTFEGQSEVLTHEIGYSSLRICSVTKELVTEAVELVQEGDEDDSRWELVFNLSVPGWIPATAVYGADNFGTRYTIYATAKFLDLDDRSSTSSWFDMLCAPFRMRSWQVNESTDILVRRYAEPPSDGPAAIGSTTYMVKPSRTTPNTSIPPDVIRKIQIKAVVPDYTDMDSGLVRLKLNIRTEGLEDGQCKRLRLTEFTGDMTQTDCCRAQPTDQQRSRYPIPADSQQPPNVPLRRTHPLAFFYHTDLARPDMSCVSERTFSIMPRGAVRTTLEDVYPFSEEVDKSSWYVLETTMPFKVNDDNDVDYVTRPTSSGPMFSARHEIRIKLNCSYDVPNSEPVTHVLGFTIPVRLAEVAAPLPPTPHTSCTDGLALPSLIPYAPLPAYSQLFYSNGDRKDPMPLPLYTPKVSFDDTLTPCSIPSTFNECAQPPPISYEKICSSYESDSDASETTSLLS